MLSRSSSISLNCPSCALRFAVSSPTLLSTLTRVASTSRPVSTKWTSVCCLTSSSLCCRSSRSFCRAQTAPSEFLEIADKLLSFAELLCAFSSSRVMASHTRDSCVGWLPFGLTNSARSLCSAPSSFFWPSLTPSTNSVREWRFTCRYNTNVLYINLCTFCMC